MGQYYRMVVENAQTHEEKFFSTRVNGKHCGEKLMEHSYNGNNVTSVITNAIFKTPSKVYWIGDYSTDIIEDLDVSEEEKEKISIYYDHLWAKDSQKYDTEISEEELITLDGLYIVNHTQECYIDFDKYKKKAIDDYGYVIYPISLLCAVGNGLGGGDFRSGKGLDEIGTWIGDIIEVTDTKPIKYDECNIIFKED